MSTIFDNEKAKAALTAIANNGIGPSARVCRAIINHADQEWNGDIGCAILDASDYVVRAVDASAQQVAAFVAKLPPTFGHRPMTDGEIASAKAREAELAAKRSDPKPAQIQKPADTGGYYRPSTGDGIADARNWAEDAYRCGDSISDE